MEIIDKKLKETYGPNENMQELTFQKQRRKRMGNSNIWRNINIIRKKPTPKEKHQATYFRNFMNPKQVKF